MHAIGRFAHEALVIDVIPVHAVTLPAKLSFLAAQVPISQYLHIQVFAESCQCHSYRISGSGRRPRPKRTLLHRRERPESRPPVCRPHPLGPRRASLPPYGLRFLFIELCWSTHRALANNGKLESPNVCFRAGILVP